MEAKIPGKLRGASWPAVFDSDGEIRRERQLHSWPAEIVHNHDEGKAVWRYIVYKGLYLLCGDEGKLMGLRHTWSRMEWMRTR